jgi:uncharacterized protein (DUF58 family)
MLTGRGWLFLVVVFLLLIFGALFALNSVAVLFLTILLWFGWEWVRFSWMARGARALLRLDRQIVQAGRLAANLQEGFPFDIRVTLRKRGHGKLPNVVAADPFPFCLQLEDGSCTATGELGPKSLLEIRYTALCPALGRVRFEGLRVELLDLHGFFYHAIFLRDPVVLRVLPNRAWLRAGNVAGIKRHNQLLPPGHHRFRKPGSGSELLNLRDYMPGDPPRTIAWKVTARRGRLITKEYESEVPIRCTVFLDASNSVRLESTKTEKKTKDHRRVAPVQELARLAHRILEANVTTRDLTGLCIFDETSSRAIPPARGPAQRNRLTRALADAACLHPILPVADPDRLIPQAFALAQELYPDLVHPSVNAMPLWLRFLVPAPRYRSGWRGLKDYLNRRKTKILFLGTFLLPLALAMGNLFLLMAGWLPSWAENGLIQGSLVAIAVSIFLACTTFWLTILFTRRQRRLTTWRKRLASLFTIRYGPPGPAELQRLLEDDQKMSLSLQRFLAEHDFPAHIPLFDLEGRYLAKSAAKTGVLAQALAQAVARARDNELFVLLVDLAELHDNLQPLLQAIRVALGRHHRVVVICPRPAGMGKKTKPQVGSGSKDDLGQEIGQLTANRFATSIEKTRLAFAQLRVPCLTFEPGRSLAFVLRQVERLRSVGGRAL